MNLTLQSLLLCLLAMSYCKANPAPWISETQQQQTRPSTSGWGWRPSSSSTKPKYPLRPQGNCNPNKPNFSQPFRPHPFPNQELLKPVFSAWPKPSSLINNQLQIPNNSANQQQQQSQGVGGVNGGGWSRPNEHLLKPVFSAWPQSNQQVLVDVPFTVEEVVSTGHNRGWRK